MRRMEGTMGFHEFRVRNPGFPFKRVDILRVKTEQKTLSTKSRIETTTLDDDFMSTSIK